MQLRAILTLAAFTLTFESGNSSKEFSKAQIPACRQSAQTTSTTTRSLQKDTTGTMSEACSSAPAQHEDEDMEGIDPNDELFATKPIKPRRMYAYDW